MLYSEHLSVTRWKIKLRAASLKACGAKHAVRQRLRGAGRKKSHDSTNLDLPSKLRDPTPRRFLEGRGFHFRKAEVYFADYKPLQYPIAHARHVPAIGMHERYQCLLPQRQLLEECIREPFFCRNLLQPTRLCVSYGARMLKVKACK